MAEYIHIGKKIAELLEQQHRSKRDLGVEIGMSPSNAVYLTTRESIDVQTLHKIGVALEYNFWKHFPIEDAPTGKLVTNPQEATIRALNEQLANRDSLIADLKRELEMQKKENGYLMEINALLKGKGSH